MKLSVLDIGTNTVLHLAVEVSDGTIHVMRDDHDIVRLGEGVDRTGELSQEAQERTLLSIKRHLDTSRMIGVERIVACGTSALRDAKNRDEFIERVKNQTGITIKVISGDEEARLTYAGAHFNLKLPTKKSIVIDIGGGSTEIAYGDGKITTAHTSINVGCVRLTERFLKHAPPSQENIDAARNQVQKLLAKKRIDIPEKDITVIGVAGTMTTLAQLVHHIVPFNESRIHGLVVMKNELQSIIELLSKKSHTEISLMPEVDERRGDILLAGLLLLDEIFSYLSCKQITVSVCGLRYGIAMKEVRG